MAGINAGPCSEATSCCGWAKLPPVQLFGAGGEETGEWRRQSGEVVADSGPRGESRAHPVPPLPLSPAWTGFGSGAPDE
jgi:hypothetical protein